MENDLPYSFLNPLLRIKWRLAPAGRARYGPFMVQYLDLPHGRLAWRQRNGTAGAPVLFLHGAGGRKEIWSPVSRRLAALQPTRPLLLVDLPGHGDAAPPGRERIEDYAADLAALLDREQWPHVALVGHSMGGAVAQALAAAQPDRVTHLALVATGPRIPVSPVILELLPDNPARLAELFAQIGFGPDTPPLLVQQAIQPLAATDPQVSRGDFLACGQWDAGDRLGRITAATLVLAGEKDNLLSPKAAQKLAAGIPGAVLEILPNSGHMLPVERDREIAVLLAALLERRE